MKLLKLIPAAAIVLTAFATFEAKAGGYPDGWDKKTSCEDGSGTKFYKLQKSDTPASYGVYKSLDKWIIENVTYDQATYQYKKKCDSY